MTRSVGQIISGEIMEDRYRQNDSDRCSWANCYFT